MTLGDDGYSSYLTALWQKETLFLRYRKLEPQKAHATPLSTLTLLNLLTRAPQSYPYRRRCRGDFQDLLVLSPSVPKTGSMSHNH